MLAPDVRNKQIDDTKNALSECCRSVALFRILSLALPLRDKEGTAYLVLVVSRDEECEVEDNNSDPQGGEAVEQPKEEWDQDE